MPSKNVARPPRLAAGAKVALVAPAGPMLEMDDLVRAQELVRALGWEPVLAPHAGGHYGYYSGTDEERLGDLNSALGDPRIDGVWCIRGGQGMTRIVAGVGMRALSRIIHASPVQAGAIKAAADAFCNAQVTPPIKARLRRWLTR